MRGEKQLRPIHIYLTSLVISGIPPEVFITPVDGDKIIVDYSSHGSLKEKKNLCFGVPIVAQQKGIQLVSMRFNPWTLSVG